jgi:hypothetical protein
MIDSPRPASSERVRERNQDRHPRIPTHTVPSGTGLLSAPIQALRARLPSPCPSGTDHLVPSGTEPPPELLRRELRQDLIRDRHSLIDRIALVSQNDDPKLLRGDERNVGSETVGRTGFVHPHILPRLLWWG